MKDSKDTSQNKVHNTLQLAGLGHWNIYFLIKLFLFWNTSIGFNPLYNLGFAAFLLIPITHRLGKIIRQLVAIPLGLALLYFDSWLPPFNRLLSESTLVKSFSTQYLLELVVRFINVELLAICVILLAAYIFVRRYIRISVLVVFCLIYLNVPLHEKFSSSTDEGLQTAQQSEAITENKQHSATNGEWDLDSYLNQFYRGEKQRVVRFSQPEQGTVPFDILFLHICSLSWDDLAYAGLEDDLPPFDILLDNFNTASSYSGPAVIRLLRANCGQSKHEDLYTATESECYLFENLKKLGFKTELLMNHDGHFDDFLGLIQQNGLDVDMMEVQKLPVPIKAFDGSPVYNDLQVLEHWLQQREVENQPPAAVLYNTVTMHDGNRYVDQRSRMSSTKNFVPRLKGMLDDLQSFFSHLEQSGRKILVVMIPEHGAAIRGDKMQMSGLREIPSPTITLGPVGLRLIGPGIESPTHPVRISKQTSYLDVIEIVSQFIRTNPFDSKEYNPESLTTIIKETALVSENAGTVVLRRLEKYYIRLDGSDKWLEYPSK